MMTRGLVLATALFMVSSDAAMAQIRQSLPPTSTLGARKHVWRNRPLGAEVRRALEYPASAKLYSLNPYRRPAEGDQVFQHKVVIGETTLYRDEAAAASRAFLRAVDDFSNADASCMCYAPRHALSIRSGSHRYDIGLFEPSPTVVIFKDDKPVGSLEAQGFQATWDALLSKHGVRVVPLRR
jgi:hypothetical protein